MLLCKPGRPPVDEAEVEGVPGAGVATGELRNEENEEAMSGAFGLNASRAARSNRFVVPVAFVDPDRAEQTNATRWWSFRYLGTISSAIVCKNLPTLVPPYFCMIQLPSEGLPLRGVGVEREEEEGVEFDVDIDQPGRNG